jgi:hypothetical protein
MQNYEMTLFLMHASSALLRLLFKEAFAEPSGGKVDGEIEVE